MRDTTYTARTIEEFDKLNCYEAAIMHAETWEMDMELSSPILELINCKYDFDVLEATTHMNRDTVRDAMKHIALTKFRKRRESLTKKDGIVEIAYVPEYKGSEYLLFVHKETGNILGLSRNMLLPWYKDFL